MSTQDSRIVAAADLPITLYLNQRLTFDLLAALEGGFSEFSTVQTTSAGKNSTELAGGAEVGISNAFGLFGVKLGGRGSRQVEQNHSESTTDEIVHTPASLFARLRRDLSERSLLHKVTDSADLSEILPGDFVEFEAALRNSPPVELLSSFAALIPLIDVFQDQQTSRGRGGGRSRAVTENTKLLNQVNAILAVLTDGGSRDLVAEIGNTRASRQSLTPDDR